MTETWILSAGPRKRVGDRAVSWAEREAPSKSKGSDVERERG